MSADSVNHDSFRSTIAITSFNRFKYLKSLMNSLSGISRDKFYFIVVDNCSEESGLQEYILEKEACGEIHKAFVRSPKDRNWVNDEYIAKNIIIENSPTDTILFLQDDLQFVGNEESLENIVSDFKALPGLCLELNGIRRVSIHNKFLSKREIAGPSGFRYHAPDDNHFQTMGLFKKQVFDIFGLYPVDWPQTQEYWGRSEDVYDAMIKRKFPNAQLNITAHVPLFLPIWNDIRGGYAFIRGNKRYGQYIEPPHESTLYYQRIDKQEYVALQSTPGPLSFVDIARPLNWSYTKDEKGDQKKYSQREIMNEKLGQDF